MVTEDEPQAVTLADVVARRETAHCSSADAEAFVEGSLLGMV